MTIYVHCPQCHTRLEVLHQACPHCGAGLPPGVLSALEAALGHTSPLPSSPHVSGWRPDRLRSSATPSATVRPGSLLSSPHSALRPWLAAMLSLVCGLGQLYNGQGFKGLLLLLGGAASVAAILLWQSAAAMVVAAVLWLYAIVDAYLVARQT